ncbi:SIS domain-containing protein [Microstroma glucosiphilum]|uniref:SIS domain-containing protein n=1 Tax=Pseudomicrostroma glucosiphilum TaxID=1684307 RepID=A0A316TWV8_9BASI|nr:SIS domain-containing protein [Pseudomicrostroma glucosiphilum]PWN17797.1 SIS domain-containing protein [Pseudomicrostroma glucosiphilum]
MMLDGLSQSSSVSEGGSDRYIDGLDSEAEDVETGDSSPSSSRASVVAENEYSPCEATGSGSALLEESLQSVQQQQHQADDVSPVTSPASSGFSSSARTVDTSLSLHEGIAQSFTPKDRQSKAASPSPPRRPRKSSASASLAHARALLEHQAASLLSAARRMREEEETFDQFERAQQLVVETLKAGGKLVWTGVGKSGIIANKLSSTSLSLGLPSAYLDPLAALHGDLGRLNGSPSNSNLVASTSAKSQLPAPPNDVLVALSHSGSSPELLGLLPHVELRGVKVIALTAQRDSALGKAALQGGGSWIDCRTAGRGGEQQELPQDFSLSEDEDESESRSRSPRRCGNAACQHRDGASCCSTSALFCSSLASALTAGTDEADADLPAPTSSTTTALAMGDSLVLSCAKMLGLGTTAEFGKNHPGGALGQRMMAEMKISQKAASKEESEKETERASV